MTLQEIDQRAKVVHRRRKQLIDAFLQSTSQIYKSRCNRLVSILDKRFENLEKMYDKQRREETRSLMMLSKFKKEISLIGVTME